VYITRLRNPASASCISGRQIVMAPVYVVCKQPRIAHRIKADVGLCMTCLNAAHEDWNPLKDGECNGTANNSSAGASNNSRGNPESRGGAESVREDDGRKQPSPPATQAQANQAEAPNENGKHFVPSDPHDTTCLL
jgi:hypothetical protein